jgi:hypothetical protein
VPKGRSATSTRAARVYRGLPHDRHTFQGRPRDYLAFLGRISPEKRLDRAIAIARDVLATVDLLLVRHEQDVGVHILRPEGDVSILVVR